MLDEGDGKECLVEIYVHGEVFAMPSSPERESARQEGFIWVCDATFWIVISAVILGLVEASLALHLSLVQNLTEIVIHLRLISRCSSNACLTLRKSEASAATFASCLGSRFGGDPRHKVKTAQLCRLSCVVEVGLPNSYLGAASCFITLQQAIQRHAFSEQISCFSYLYVRWDDDDCIFAHRKLHFSENVGFFAQSKLNH